jgi:membrane protease YdiL (CAAX protease family)
MSEYLSLLSEFLGVIAVTMLVALSSRFERGPVKFLRPQTDGLLALGLILLTALMLLAGSGPGIDMKAQALLLTGKIDPNGYSLSDMGRQLMISFISLLPFAAVFIFRKQKLLSVGLGKRNFRPALLLGLGLALLAIFLRGKIYAIMHGISVPQAYILAALTGIAFSEEIIFRGFIQLRLVAWLGEYRGWIITALIFTLWRTAMLILIVGFVLEAIWVNLFITLIFGLILGWIMRKSSNIFAPAIYHAAHNWLLYLI